MRRIVYRLAIIRLLVCYIMTVQQGVWRWREDKAGVVQDGSWYPRCHCGHPSGCVV